jgi:hypothetical protein
LELYLKASTDIGEARSVKSGGGGGLVFIEYEKRV